MAVYSYDQLKKLWTDNGGNPTYAAMAAAIALAESGGNTGSVSKLNSNGTHDYGLWQISLKGDGTAMLDPQANVKRAISMSNNGTNWHPWCTAYSDAACGSKGGKYLAASSPFWKFLAGTGAQAPPANAPTGGSSSPQIADVSAHDDCLISLPSIGPIGGGCLLSTGKARAIGGVLLITGSTGIFLLGIVLLSGKGGSLLKGAAMAVAPETGAATMIGTATKKGGVKKGGPAKSEAPLSAQDKEDLNLEMQSKRQASEKAKEPPKPRQKPGDTGVHKVGGRRHLGRVRSMDEEPF